MTADRRARILARCDELDQLADAAAGPRNIDRWTVAPLERHFVADWMAPGTRGLDRARAKTPEIAALIAAFGPSGVRRLTAGARKMCEIHQTEVLIYKGTVIRPRPGSDPDGEDCEGCGYAEGAEWLRNTIGECPSLAATELMLGLAELEVSEP